MNTTEDFSTYVGQVEAKSGYQKPTAFALGLRRKRGETTLDVFYPHINYESSYGTAAVIADVSSKSSYGKNGYVVLSPNQISDALDKFAPFKGDGKKHDNIDVLNALSVKSNSSNGYSDTDVIAYFMYDTSTAVETPEEGYFKTQCISQLKVKPHQINCGGIFGKMNNIAWTNQGPILPEDLALVKISATLRGDELVVSHVDKFPYMVNYYIPHGVRVVSGSQVRLGAHLSSGTTVMPAGYVNFNAGTLGSAMIEGRVSGGVVVGNQSDIGGGASIMGTLSGGNKNVISIGENCLLGANAGTGISLGDGCTVAAGVYITSAAKVSLYNKDKQPVNISGDLVTDGENVVKGAELDGRSYMLYYNDSMSGKLIGRPNTKTIELNESLHA